MHHSQQQQRQPPGRFPLGGLCLPAAAFTDPLPQLTGLASPCLCANQRASASFSCCWPS
jgi:hypothetical protein